MSFEITNTLRKIKVGNPTAKAVLMRLADYANEHGECFPSIQLLTDETEFTDKAVKNAIGRLEAISILYVERKRGASNRYKITPQLYQAPLNQVEKVRNVIPPCTTFTRESHSQPKEPRSLQRGNHVPPNHHITINNHHSGGDTCVSKISDLIFETTESEAQEFESSELPQQQPQKPESILQHSEFIPVHRKYAIPYF